jgi:hypothetical protein
MIRTVELGDGFDSAEEHVEAETLIGRVDGVAFNCVICS